MKIRSALIVAAALLVAAAAPVFAHHSFAAEFDVNKPTTLTGSVTKLDWINPHARLLIEAKGSDGKVANWDIELGPPAMLMRSGWTKNSLKIGDEVSVVANPAKDASRPANAQTVTLSDGRRAFARSSADCNAQE